MSSINRLCLHMPKRHCIFDSSSMVLHEDSDTIYLVLPHAKSRTLGYYYISDQIMYKVGTEQTLLNQYYSALETLATSTWIVHLWEFLHMHNLRIFLPRVTLPSSSCFNNYKFINDMIIQGWKQDNLRVINKAKLSLHVHFVSDLLVHVTTKIKRCLLKGIPDTSA